MDRREFLAAAGATTAVLTAGCNQLGKLSTDTGPKWPEHSQSLPDGWEEKNRYEKPIERTIEKNGVEHTVTARARSVVYEDFAVAEELQEETMGAASGPFVSHFATKIRFHTELATAIDAPRLADDLEAQFKSQIEEMELTLDGEPQKSSSTENGTTYERRAYIGEAPAKPVELPAITRPDGTKRDIKPIQFDAIPFKAFYEVWKPGRKTALIGGGAYPDVDKLEKTREFSLSGEEEEGVDVTLDINIDFDPEEYSSDVESLVDTLE